MGLRCRKRSLARRSSRWTCRTSRQQTFLSSTRHAQIPDAFLWIKLRSIAWQAFEMDAFGSTFAQKVFDWLRAMNGSSVPDHQQLAWDLAQEQRPRSGPHRVLCRNG